MDKLEPLSQLKAIIAEHHQRARDPWPQPFDSKDDGEVWKWQEYTFVLQKNPIMHGYTCGRVATCLHSLMLHLSDGMEYLNIILNTSDERHAACSKTNENEKLLFGSLLNDTQSRYSREFPTPPFSFFYALLAFSTAPNQLTDSSWPLYCAGIGEFDLSILRKYYDALKKDVGGFLLPWLPLELPHDVFSVFFKEKGGIGFGEKFWNPYSEETSSLCCRTHLFGEFQRHLNLTGTPIRVGSISSILG